MMQLNVPKLIAHRGGLAYAPENSRSAFLKCIELECRFVEIDVRLSACGEPIVFHDDSLRRISNGRGGVHENNWDEIQQLDIGTSFSRKFKGEKILHFSQAIDFLMSHKMGANIELKPTKDDTYELVASTLSLIMEKWSLNDGLPLISSFEIEALSLAQTISPEIPRGLLLDTWREDWKKIIDDLACASVHLSSKIANKARIDMIKASGRQVFVYTVNQQKKAKQLLEMGVDAIFSDYPDLLVPKKRWFFGKPKEATS